MQKEHLALGLKERIAKYGDRKALCYKDKGQWKEISWNEMGQQAEAVAKALVQLGIAENEMVGLFSANMPKWTIADLGILMARCTSVPIHAPSTVGQAEYIINDAKVKLLFVGGQEQYAKAMKFFEDNPHLQTIVCFDPEVKLEDNPAIMHWDDFINIGQQAVNYGEIEARLDRAQTDDLCTLIYTSGTTGEPKGVMLDHANFCFQYRSHMDRFPQSDTDRSLCILPLSHVFERTWTYNVLMHGMTNYYCDDPTQALEYFQEVKPHFACMVPRLYEKIYAGVFNQLESAPPAKRKLFNWALGVGKAAGKLRNENKDLPYLLKVKHNLADKLVLSKIRNLTGGDIRVFPCAGAPLAADIDEFFWSVGVYLCLGFGMTETTATVTCHPLTGKKFGNCGTVLMQTEMKLADDGELLVKGPQIMRGYYNKPEETAKTIVDGWLLTGDIATIDADGHMKITDRKKELMKTSGGKYIAPQPIENRIGADHYIEQVIMVADLRKFASALVVPNFEALEQYAKDKGIAYSSHDDLVKNPKIHDFYAERIERLVGDVEKQEKIRKFTLLAEEFTIEDGEITPTLKLKRKVILEKFADTIDAMYQD